MYIIPDNIEDYCITHSDNIPEYLNELERATHLRTLAPQMLSGKLMGRFLSMLSKIHSPQCIIEIGTFTGYGSLCLAEGLPDGGELHTFEVNDELIPIINEFQSKSPYKDKINVHLGAAEKVFPTLNIQPDLAFIDAGKLQYADHYEMLMSSMQSGGIILVDNVLWSGKVVEKADDNDTKAIHAFNQKVEQDERCHKVVLPIRDGLTMIRIK